ncbi:P-loop NTPase [bacterium]|nr:P-loop NTPase [bacterium]
MNGSPNIVGKKIWAVAGGKGGTGKSVMAANTGIILSSLGYKVILVDADLGGPNLHTCLNIRRPAYTLNDFLNNKLPALESTLLDTPNENLKLISGGTEILGIANIHYQKKLKLLRHLEKLDADFIIVDLGAGTAFNTIDFFNLSNEGILVCNPEPNAKLDTYSFLKNVVWRKLSSATKNNGIVREVISRTNYANENKIFEVSKLLELVREEDEDSYNMMDKILQDFRPKLIMNKVRRRGQIAEAEQIAALAKGYLCVKIDYLGHVESDPRVVEASEKMMPFILEYPKCNASKNLFSVVKKLISFQSKKEDSFRKFRKGIKVEARHWE